MTSQTRTALVIGSGIAGPVVATALHKAGIEATVVEAYPTAAEGVGGVLRLAPNGVNALDAIDAGDAVRAIARPMGGTILHSGDGEVLGEARLPEHLPPAQFVRRGELHRVLHEEASRRGIRTEHGKRLVRAEDGADGVTAYFADGTQATADILIGADGIRSVVRAAIDPDAPQPHYGGLIGFGATMDHTGLPATANEMHVSYGRNGTFGHMVFDDASGAWYVNLPHPEPMTITQQKEVGNEQWMKVIREAFLEDCFPAAELLARTDPADLVITGPLETMPVVPTWSRGRMVLVGDSVHAASPSSGQGASLAIESAVQLARCLRDLPHPEAFAAYEELRRERVEKIIDKAARVNRSKADPGAHGSADLKPEDTDWQFTYRIDWDVPVGSRNS